MVPEAGINKVNFFSILCWIRINVSYLLKCISNVFSLNAEKLQLIGSSVNARRMLFQVFEILLDFIEC